MMDLFPLDFRASRERFRARVGDLDGALHSLPIASSHGPVTDDLSVDIGVLGELSAPKKIVHVAGVHGVEAFAGSAVQSAILQDMPTVPSDTAVVFVHCFNPWGMSNLRRNNQHNVDLNRNCVLPPHERAGAPAGYDRVRDLISPATTPAFSTFALRAVLSISLHGFSSVKQAIAGGQFIDAKGLFYGGSELEQELVVFREWLSASLSETEHLVVIDLHTGLGSFGQETLLVECARHSQQYERIVELFGAEKVQAPDTDGGIAYSSTGELCNLFMSCFPSMRVDCVVQEFGTYHALQVLHAMVVENTDYRQGRVGPTSPGGQKLKETFCPDSPRWRQEVVARGQALLSKVLGSLSR
jgi:hypothetical protein